MIRLAMGESMLRWELSDRHLTARLVTLIFLLVEYIPLLAGNTLFTSDQPLLSIVAFQFIPVYIIIALLSMYFFRKTGRIYAGAFICAIFITALIVTSTAMQYAVIGR